MQLGQSASLTFHQVENIKSYDDNLRNDDPYILGIYLRSNKKHDVYSRQVTDILTFMGDIGGLSEALLSIGMVLVGFISQKMFMSKIVRKIYHIRKYDNIDQEAEKHSLRVEAGGGPGTRVRAIGGRFKESSQARRGDTCEKERLTTSG